MEIGVVCASGGKVTIDVVLMNEEAGHLLLCEVKSGNNIEDEQALRYGQIDARSVVVAAAITLPQKGNLTVEVVYVCLSEGEERITQGLNAIEVDYPLISVDALRIKLLRTAAASTHLRSAFPGDCVDLIAPPAALIDIDHDSSISDFVKKTRPYLVRAAARRIEEVSVPRICEDLFPFYRRYQPSVRNQIAKRVQAALKQLAQEDPDTYRYESVPDGGPEGVVRLLRKPEEFDNRGRTAAYQSLARVSRRRRAKPVDPNQLDLLAELGEKAETDEDPEATGEAEPS
ncbi:hypothetical protein [Streptomyces sp. NPDC001221]